MTLHQGEGSEQSLGQERKLELVPLIWKAYTCYLVIYGRIGKWVEDLAHGNYVTR